MGKRFTLDLPDEARAFYREAAAKRQRVTSTCAVCGQVIEGTTRKRLCSHACQQRAYYRRRRAQAAAQAGADSATRRAHQ